MKARAPAFVCALAAIGMAGVCGMGGLEFGVWVTDPMTELDADGSLSGRVLPQAGNASIRMTVAEQMQRKRNTTDPSREIGVTVMPTM
jgi:hypothetical protein